MTHTRNDISELLSAHGLSPRRAFGQNFVVDANTVRRIARLAGVGPGDFVLEIGAGLGSLTLALAETGATIVAIEIDNGVVEVLRTVVKDLPNVEVIHGDALLLDWAPLQARSQHWHVVANLPYNVATPLVADLLDGAPAVDHMLVMVQKEVPNDLSHQCAPPLMAQSASRLRTGQPRQLLAMCPHQYFFQNQMSLRLSSTSNAALHLQCPMLTQRNFLLSCALVLANAAKCFAEFWPASSHPKHLPVPMCRLRPEPKNLMFMHGVDCVLRNATSWWANEHG